MRIVWLALTLLCGAAGDALAQRLIVEGGTGHPAGAALHEIVERGDYRVIDRDTVLPAAFRHEGDLVVVDAVVRLEGSVTGSIGVVGGSFFLRPGARVGGVAVAVAGIIGMSSLATVADTLIMPLAYGVEVERVGEDYQVRIQAPPRSAIVRPQGLLGIVFPSYDRVNGASVRVGLGGSIGSDSLGPGYEVVGSYFSARGEVGGRGEITLPLGGRAHIAVAGGREVMTRDAWIRGDLSNSLSALVVGSDVRNYFESDFLSVMVAELPPSDLQVRQGYIVARTGVLASRDRSLRARDPWTLFGDDPWRPNPPVFDGTLTSAIFGVSAGWRGVTSSFESAADLEWAFPSPLGFSWGEQDFVQLVADGRWSLLAMWNHTLSVRAHAMQSFGPDAAPPQRWSLIGGPGTLPTLEQGELRGDNVVFVQSAYSIPITPLTIPFFGMPELSARHAVGSAWVTDTDAPRWQQNLGVGVRFSVIDLFLYVDPAAGSRDPHFSVGFHLPR